MQKEVRGVIVVVIMLMGVVMRIGGLLCSRKVLFVSVCGGQVCCLPEVLAVALPSKKRMDCAACQ